MMAGERRPEWNLARPERIRRLMGPERLANLARRVGENDLRDSIMRRAGLRDLPISSNQIGERFHTQHLLTGERMAEKIRHHLRKTREPAWLRATKSGSLLVG